MPQEVIKQRLVTGIYPNFGNAVTSIWRLQGPPGFYAGWLPTVSRNVPFVVCAFTSFAAMEKRRLQTTGEATLGLADSLTIGVLSALVAGFVTHPVDVVKTRMMTQAATSATPYKSVADCIATMWRAGRAGELLRGLEQRSVYMGPLWALQFGLNARLLACCWHIGARINDLHSVVLSTFDCVVRGSPHLRRRARARVAWPHLCHSAARTITARQHIH